MANTGGVAVSGFDAAIRAAAPDAPPQAVEAFEYLDPGRPPLGTSYRIAHLIGQCAHESLGFTRAVESLWYSAERLMAVWPSRFRTEEKAEAFAADPEKLANEVYGGRLGNNRPGDGWRYRGRGWLQLTGRSNYTRFGKLVGLPLVELPELAEEPDHAWRIALAYFKRRRRARRTTLEWADRDNVEMVTRIVNGGLHGLEDRRLRTAQAFTALEGPPLSRDRAEDMAREYPDAPFYFPLSRGSEGSLVVALQHGLARAGHPPGPLDGMYGPRTEAAVRDFQRAEWGVADGVAALSTFYALGLVEWPAGKSEEGQQ